VYGYSAGPRRRRQRLFTDDLLNLPPYGATISAALQVSAGGGASLFVFAGLVSAGSPSIDDTAYLLRLSDGAAPHLVLRKGACATASPTPRPWAPPASSAGAPAPSNRAPGCRSSSSGAARVALVDAAVPAAQI
jgi:hypothetical protein